MSDLSYFIGRVCTILTKPINRQFSEEDNINYFIGEILSIDALGITIASVVDDTRSFFYKESIIGICEEPSYNPEDEEDLKKIAEHENKKREIFMLPSEEPAPEPIPEQQSEPMVYEEGINDQPFLDTNALREMAKQAKQIWSQNESN